MNESETAALEALRAWRRGNTARVLVIMHDGAIGLIEWRGGSRHDAGFSSATEAAMTLAAGNVHWQRRSVELGGLCAGRNWMGHLIANPTHARPMKKPQREPSQSRKAIRLREKRARERAARVNA